MKIVTKLESRIKEFRNRTGSFYKEERSIDSPDPSQSDLIKPYMNSIGGERVAETFYNL